MTPPPSNLMPLETLVIGGGVAGLWILDQLLENGHQAGLVEANALGQGQSVAAQGILHGGVKYSLSGLLAPGARQVAKMPDVWAEHLAGRAKPDLSATTVRSRYCHLWRTDSMKSILGMTGAKLALQAKPRKLARKDRPAILRNCPGDVALLPESVLETPSLLAALAQRHQDHLLHGRIITGSALGNEDSDAWVEIEPRDSDKLILQCKQIILCAGAGNEALIKCLLNDENDSPPAMQRRPLHMSMLKGPLDELPELNGHCVDGAATRVTITSSTAADGQRVWQLGGQLSETGCERDPEAQTEAARSCLQEVLPGFDVDNPRFTWASYRIDRAEFRESHNSEHRRPDDVAVLPKHRAIIVWPTKLVLAPRAAKKVLRYVGVGSGPSDTPFMNLPTPPVAEPPWEGAEWN
jgi:glycine/D-amino acid oxidase-like deaminating enzyme